MDILVVDDEVTIREAALQLIEDAGHYAEPASDLETAMAALTSTTFDLVLLDLHLGDENGLDVLRRIREKFPRLSVVMFSGLATIAGAIEATRVGAIDFLEKPFTRDQLAVVLQRVRHVRDLEARVETLSVEAAGQEPELRYQSQSPKMREILDVLTRAAPSTASILLLGESGTGKSTVAREIHARSNRKDKPFVTINCPALSRELLESELFGHVRGAFTGAVKDTRGKVHAADGGTLFLDEIGELPKEIQPKLLRLLQDWEYERVGENTTRRADVRVIAATNRVIEEEVREGRFREDLFFRLNVISVELPTLRDRREDIVGFATSYLEFFAARYASGVSGFSAAATALLESYPWPGNLRELRNAIERAVILARGKKIESIDLPNTATRPLRLDGNNDPSSVQVRLGGDFSLQEIEDAHLLHVIETTPTLAAASQVLGIDEATLYRKRKRLDLPIQSLSSSKAG